jgi:hypothetical protein
MGSLHRAAALLDAIRPLPNITCQCRTDFSIGLYWLLDQRKSGSCTRGPSRRMDPTTVHFADARVSRAR